MAAGADTHWSVDLRATFAVGLWAMATGRRTVVVLVAAVGAAAFLVVSASSSAPSAAGTLNLRATLATSSPSATCPPEAPPGADCHPRTGTGSVRDSGRSSRNTPGSSGRGTVLRLSSSRSRPLVGLSLRTREKSTSRSRTEPGASSRSLYGTSRRSSQLRAARMPIKGRPGAARLSARSVGDLEWSGGLGR